MTEPSETGTLEAVPGASVEAPVDALVDAPLDAPVDAPLETSPSVSGTSAGDEAAGADAGADPGVPARTRTVVTLEQEGEVAADYLEELLDICDLDGDLDLDVEGDRAVVAIVGSGLDHLVGEKGRVLDAIQELTRLAVLAQTGQRSRLMLDIAGHRAGVRAELTKLGTETAQQVATSGEAARLSSMTPFERKVVHDAVAAVAGVHSESEGEEPHRRVVVLPG